MLTKPGRQPGRKTHWTWCGSEVSHWTSVHADDDLLAHRINVAGDFQIAPNDTVLQRCFISVGQVCDRGNIITFRSSSGTIINELTGNRIEFDRAGGVYRLRSDTSAKPKSEPGGVKVSMGFEQDTAGAAEAQLAKTWKCARIAG